MNLRNYNMLYYSPINCNKHKNNGYCLYTYRHVNTVFPAGC